MTAANAPWRARPAISTGRAGARPAINEATPNPARPSWKVRRRPKTSASRPPSSSRPAKQSVYAVTTHCRCPSPKPSERCADGSAMLTIVASSAVISWATAITPRTAPGRRVPARVELAGREGAVEVMAATSLNEGFPSAYPDRRPSLRLGVIWLPLNRGGPLRADARRNSERLVEAARDVFVERGPDGSLEEIARRAGVGIATLYRRFVDRSALMRAVVLSALSPTAEAAERIREEEPDPLAALAAYVHAVIDLRTSAVIPTLLGSLDLKEKELAAARERSARLAQ